MILVPTVEKLPKAAPTRVRKDGSRFLASVTVTALRDAAGNLRGFSEFSHDLSESMESGAKYRALLKAVPDAMVVVNQGSGEIVLLNVQEEKHFGGRRIYRQHLRRMADFLKRAEGREQQPAIENSD